MSNRTYSYITLAVCFMAVAFSLPAVTPDDIVPEDAGDMFDEVIPEVPPMPPIIAKSTATMLVAHPPMGSGSGDGLEDHPMEKLLPFIHECQGTLPADDMCATMDPMSCEDAEGALADDCDTCKGKLEGCVKDKVGDKTITLFATKNIKSTATMLVSHPPMGSGSGDGLEDHPMEKLLPFIHECQGTLPADDMCATMDPMSCEDAEGALADDCDTCKGKLEGCVKDKVSAKTITLFQIRKVALVQTIVTKDECMGPMCGDHVADSDGMTPSGFFITQTTDAATCAAFKAAGHSCEVVGSECHYDPCSSELAEACAAEFGHSPDCESNDGPSMEELMPFIKECQKELPANMCTTMDVTKCAAPQSEEEGEACKECAGKLGPCVKTKYTESMMKPFTASGAGSGVAPVAPVPNPKTKDAKDNAEQQAWMPFIQKCQAMLLDGDVCKTLDPDSCAPDPPPANCEECKGKLTKCVKSLMKNEVPTPHKCVGGEQEDGSYALCIGSSDCRHSNNFCVEGVCNQEDGICKGTQGENSGPNGSTSETSKQEKSAKLLPFIKECQSELPDTNECKTLDPSQCDLDNTSKPACVKCKNELEGCVKGKMSTPKNSNVPTPSNVPTKDECMPALCGDNTIDSAGKTSSGFYITQTNDAAMCAVFKAAGHSCKVVQGANGSECHYDPCSSALAEECARHFGSFTGSCSKDSQDGPSMEELMPFIKQCQSELEATDNCSSKFDVSICSDPKTEEAGMACQECKATLEPCVEDKFIAFKKAVSNNEGKPPATITTIW